MPNPLMTISEMCETFDVTARTLRFYETKELLSPIRQGQRRLYNNRERARLKLIQRGKRFGIPLEEIRQLLDLYDLDDQMLTQIQQSCDIGEKRLAAMQRQRDELGASIAELTTMLKRGKERIAELTRTTNGA